MAATSRENIQKGEMFLIFIDFLGRNLFGNYFAEDAITHELMLIAQYADEQ